MFRNIIAPIQAWLISQGKCVACGTPLEKINGDKQKIEEKVSCAKCGRIFIYNKKGNKFRRAPIEK